MNTDVTPDSGPAPGIWTSIFCELPVADAFRTLHGYGWRTLEIGFEHIVEIENSKQPDRAIEQTRKCAAELGLSTPQAHGLLGARIGTPDPEEQKTAVARLRRHLEIAAALGVKTIVMHPDGYRRSMEWPELQRVRKLNVDSFRSLGDSAGERGIRIGLENLMCPGASTPVEMLDLIDAIGHPAIGITFDTSHANVVRLDIPAAIRDFGKFLIATHISDNNHSGDQHLMPGEGTIDWPSVMTAFADIGYHGMLNLEIPGERHPVLALRQLKIRHAYDVIHWLAGLASPVAQSAGAE